VEPGYSKTTGLWSKAAASEEPERGGNVEQDANLAQPESDEPAVKDLRAEGGGKMGSL